MVLTTYVLLFCLVWLLLYAYLFYAMRNLPRFERFVPPTPSSWPRLSVLVPACNEAEHIEAAARSLMQQDYPNLEIILINDRSTDETGTIINKLATEDERIKVIHINELPTGWLGKVHALHQGKQQASGDWMLITDADIYYTAGLLRKAVAYSLDNDIDHLALLPDVILDNFWLEVAVSTFGLLFLLNTRATQVNKVDSTAIIGVGAFNLVKRDTFNKTPGFEWLRLEVVDDVGVGLMIHNAGGQSHFALANKELSLTWYDSLASMFRGLEKNLFGAGAHYRWWRSALQVSFLWALLVAPVVALTSGSPILMACGVLVVVVQIIFSLFCERSGLLTIAWPAAESIGVVRVIL
jgi:cellulose synthase/poly-beta-1,6-N-acetylglucosamine synthase-like glycosyltransferase